MRASINRFIDRAIKEEIYDDEEYYIVINYPISDRA